MSGNKVTTTDGKATEIVHQPNPAGMAFANPADIPDLDEVEVGASLTQTYIEFNEVGEKMRGIFNGFKTNQVHDQNDGHLRGMQVAVFQTNHGVVMNGGANLLGQLENVPPGTALEVEYVGDEKTGNNRTVKVYQIRLLNVKVPVTITQQAERALPEPETVEAETDEAPAGERAPVQMYSFDDHHIVEAYAQAHGITVQKAAYVLHGMHSQNLVGDALTVAEAQQLD